MTSNTHASDRILGSLRSEAGDGITRMEDRFGTSIDDLWSALTEPRRLAGWYGEVEGNLRVGGEFHVRHADGERTGRVDACEPPQHLLVRLRDADPRPGQPEEILIDAELTADGGQTVLVVEVRGPQRTYTGRDRDRPSSNRNRCRNRTRGVQGDNRVRRDRCSGRAAEHQ